MSEMTSAVETQQQQQQYVGSGTNAEHHCKDCGLKFESEKSLEVHLHYHQENLLNQWANKAQQEESNNNHSKTGNHNSHVSTNRDSVPADSSEPSSMSPSQDPTSSQQQTQQQPQQQQSQQQQSQQPAIHTIVCQPYEHFRTPVFNESGYFMQNEQTYIMPHHFSPSQEEGQNNGGRDGGYVRYHPYQHQQLYPSDRATSNSTSPQNPPFQCDKCGGICDDANQLNEHMRTNHLDSPTAYSSAPQYQQLGNSPQQQGQQMHPSPPLSAQPQSGYDYNSVQTIKTEMKEQPEEQAEILDLDSHKVQTHRYQEIIRMQQQQQQQQQQQGLQMQGLQMHHQQVMQQQQQSGRVEALSVSSMINWSPIQTHDYHAGHPSMGSINNVPPITDQDQYMRGQHMPVEHGHQGSPIITNTQPMSGHQMPPAAGFVQQTPKATPLANQSWKSNEPRRPKTYNCTACNKWFTSSGHLKRHYNTTLHKNAVKNGKEPDPANLPIANHHHPTRENNTGHSTSGRSAPARSPPELSSRSPPNLMAGPLGEATRGLLHTPTTLCNNSSSSSSSSSESLTAALVQQQQQQQLIHVGIINSPVPSPLEHHQQQMGTAPQQLGLQQQQPHLPTGLSGQPVHHSTISPTMPPPAASHMSCPSPMDSSSHPVHHMNSPLGSAHPMTSPTAMGGTTMPPQPYPNDLPPHVTITTPAAPQESTQIVTTMRLLTIGNEQDERPRHRLLPGFKTIVPNFTEFEYIDQNQTQAINVGGLNVEEIAPQESLESSFVSIFDPFTMQYRLLNGSDVTLQMSSGNTMQNQENVEIALCYDFERQIDIENNNYPLQLGQAKEDLDPNVGLQIKKERKSKDANRQCQVTDNTNCISKDGIYKCFACNKTFNKPCYLTQHNKSFHSGDKPFKCSQCGKRFPNKEVHEKHTEMHSMARKHKCNACPKVFAHKTDLKRHNCIHTGNRPFSCETCGKGFIRQDHMKKHQDTHNKKQRQNAQRQAAQRIRVNTQRPNAQRVNIQRSQLNPSCVKL